MSDTVEAPFTEDQVDSLNGFQVAGLFHPFTCGGASCRDDLVATVDGWVCPSCGNTQKWANRFMADWSWCKPTVIYTELKTRLIRRLSAKPELLNEIMKRLEDDETVE